MARFCVTLILKSRDLKILKFPDPVFDLRLLELWV